MFAPTKTWRKWHKKINQNQKRYAIASALAATALPALVMARGHRISEVAEIPLVVPDNFEGVTKTKAAIKALTECGAMADVEKAASSKKLRAGKGKLRNRRHVMRRGPLFVYGNNDSVVNATRNLAGVETISVDRLNLLQLAPGGHLGRFCIWTKSAFEKLNAIYGSVNRESSVKKGWTLPRNIMTNSDVTRLINSDEVQAVVRPVETITTRRRQKKNPLKNLGVKVRLNPYSLSVRRSELLAAQARKENKAKTVAKKRGLKPSEKKAHFARISAD
jgi:large subunit ribosomal protein L4e